MQCLFSSNVFVNEVFSKKVQSPIIKQIRNLFVDLCLTGYQSVDTLYFINYIPTTGDPIEFLMYVFGEMTALECVKYQRNYEGECSKCHNKEIMTAMDTFLMLYNSNDEHHLSVMMDRYINDRQLICSKCNTLIDKKDIEIVHLPKLLCCSIQNIDVCDGNVRKIKQCVEYEEEITMHGYKYRLLSLITHVGHEVVGHCRAFIKSKDKWYGLDDSNVYEWNKCLFL